MFINTDYRYSRLKVHACAIYVQPPRNFIRRNNGICRQVMALQEVSRVTSIHLNPNGPLTHRPGPSRCFPFWQELLACYVVNTNTEDISGGKKCLPAMDDYYECLHHRKEVSCPVTLNQDNHRSMWLIQVNHWLSTSWQGQNHYRLHIGRRSWNFRARIQQEQAQFGIWGCWIRKRIVRLFWRQARSGNCSIRPNGSVAFFYRIFIL